MDFYRILEYIREYWSYGVLQFCNTLLNSWNTFWKKGIMEYWNTVWNSRKYWITGLCSAILDVGNIGYLKYKMWKSKFSQILKDELLGIRISIYKYIQNSNLRLSVFISDHNSRTLRLNPSECSNLDFKIKRMGGLFQRKFISRQSRVPASHRIEMHATYRNSWIFDHKDYK